MSTPSISPRPSRVLAAARRALLTAAALLAFASFGGPAVLAQENYNFTVAVLGGAGGALDAEPDPGLANPSFALALSMITEPRTQVGLRAGFFEVSDEDESFGGVADARLEYATLYGEYRLSRGYYDSGLFGGIGGYRLTGDVLGEDFDDTAVGGVVGVSGEFRLAPWVGFQVEFAAHYANLDAAQFLLLGHAGFAFHF